MRRYRDAKRQSRQWCLSLRRGVDCCEVLPRNRSLQVSAQSTRPLERSARQQAPRRDPLQVPAQAESRTPATTRRRASLCDAGVAHHHRSAGSTTTIACQHAAAGVCAYRWQSVPSEMRRGRPQFQRRAVMSERRRCQRLHRYADSQHQRAGKPAAQSGRCPPAVPIRRQEQRRRRPGSAARTPT